MRTLGYFTLIATIWIVGGCAEVVSVEDGSVNEDADTSCTLPEPAQHRFAASMCDNMRSTPPVDFSGPGGGGGCTSHEECIDGVNGRCTIYPRGWSQCTYDGCFADSACGSGPCICGTGDYQENRCMQGNCQTDSDCGPGGYCSPSFGDCGAYSGVVGYFCHTCEDECTNDSDCSGEGSGWGDPYCAFNPATERWSCSDSHCVG